MKTPGKLLFVTEFCGFAGGIERYAWRTAGLLRAAGFRVELLYRETARDAGIFAGNFDAVSTRLTGDADAVIIHKLRSPAMLAELFDRFGERSVVIAHDHELYCPRTYYYTPFGRRNCSRAYHRFYCGVCGSLVSPRHFPDGVGGLLADRFLEFPRRFELLHRAGRVVALSRFMLNNLLRNKFSERQLELLHPEVEIPDVRPPRPGDGGGVPVMAFSGQLLRGKGADSFVAMLSQLGVPYRALIAGAGPEEAGLRALAAKLGVAVEFTGYLRDPGEIYRRSDFLVLPFFWQEPFGLVGAEAAAYGRAVVATDLGGVREWLRDGETGLVVPPRDLSVLADAARRLLGSAELRIGYGDAAREFARREFSGAGFIDGFSGMLAALP